MSFESAYYSTQFDATVHEAWVADPPGAQVPTITDDYAAELQRLLEDGSNFGPMDPFMQDPQWQTAQTGFPDMSFGLDASIPTIDDAALDQMLLDALQATPPGSNEASTSPAVSPATSHGPQTPPSATSDQAQDVRIVTYDAPNPPISAAAPVLLHKPPQQPTNWGPTSLYQNGYSRFSTYPAPLVASPADPDPCATLPGQHVTPQRFRSRPSRAPDPRALARQNDRTYHPYARPEPRTHVHSPHTPSPLAQTSYSPSPNPYSPNPYSSSPHSAGPYSSGPYSPSPYARSAPPHGRVVLPHPHHVLLPRRSKFRAQPCMKVFFTSNGEAPFLPDILLGNAPIDGGEDAVFEGCGWIRTKVEIDLPHLLDKPHNLNTKDRKGNPVKREFFAKYLTMEIRRLLDSVRDKPRIRTYETEAERRIFASWPLERISFDRLRLVGADYYREWVPKLILDESHLVCPHQAVVWDV
ncbi:uncharacterized protein SCHCODRAFT_02603907 [Schizophyllum commune H4-8]|nr:uncharacterized protein SCHCODRAFT_02603907 [Schizophyllum commune H4-8]KAI5898990.1 hypothetical protein SCHCODRAFT_02603907 [Schizophyllum commune H4-8]